MSADHGEILMQKPISEYARYMKNLIPVKIPGTYDIKPMFGNLAREDKIRDGILAFRDFMFLFCDRVISDGDLYARPQKTKNLADYPFLHNINHLLIDIGYHSKLTEDGDSLLITDIPSFRGPKPKIPVSKQVECLRFLSHCGFAFTGIDLEAKKFNIMEAQLIEVSYPSNPSLVVGLKVLSIADIELRTRRYSNDDNIFMCDYRLIKEADTVVLDILKDFLHPLSEELQKLALELHQHYINRGMTCVTIKDDAIHFAYSYIKNSKRSLSIRDIYQQRVWEFALSMKYGYCLVVRSKKQTNMRSLLRTSPCLYKKRLHRDMDVIGS